MKRLLTLNKFIVITAAGIIVFLAITATGIKNNYEIAFVKTNIDNQHKVSKLLSHSIKGYFDSIKHTLENLALSETFAVDKTVLEDQIRTATFDNKLLTTALEDENIPKILKDKREVFSENQPTGTLKVWQVYKGLPENYKGKTYGLERRRLARNLLKSHDDIDYVFEMDANGDIVFVEPYDTQKRLMYYNYSFRHYLKRAKKSRKTSISESYLGSKIHQNKERLLTFATPIFDDSNKIQKIVAASVSSDTLKKRIFYPLLESMHLNDGTAFYLIDNHAHVISTSSEELKLNKETGGYTIQSLRQLPIFNNLSWTQEILNEDSSFESIAPKWMTTALKPNYSEVYENLHGQTVLGTFTPMSLFNDGEKNWGVLIETPVSGVYARAAAAKSSLDYSYAAIFTLLALLLVFFYLNLKGNLKAHKEFRREFEDIVAQFAHDIRSPIGALQIALEGESNFSPKKKNLIDSSLKRIHEIADTLANYGNDEKPSASKAASMIESPAPSNIESTLVQSVVDQVISEKKYSQLKGRKIIYRNLPLETLFFQVNPVEFKRMLSNIINNSIEATEEDCGEITISLSNTESAVSISVKDNGSGIPQEQLPKIFDRYTSSKGFGHGLGLYHAKKKMSEWGGSIKIYSKPQKGTVVTLTLPREETPPWFAESIPWNEFDSFHVLDDDPLVHESWRIKLKNYNHKPIHYYTNVESFLENYKSGENALYLIDHDIKGDTCTGADLIISLRIQDRSILVTNHFDDSQLITQCVENKIRILPKVALSKLQIDNSFPQVQRPKNVKSRITLVE